MNIGLIGLIVVFAAFILLLIINPRLSCFGKRITSPLYPLMKKRRMNSRPGHRAPGQPAAPGEAPKPGPRTEDYGFRLDETGKPVPEPGPKNEPSGPDKGKKPAKKGEDYGFHLDK